MAGEAEATKLIRDHRVRIGFEPGPGGFSIPSFSTVAVDAYVGSTIP